MADRRTEANGREIWVIKAGFPDTPKKKQWSDYAFANTIRKYLEKRGYYVVVESRDEWEREEAADVVIALRGPEAYFPDRSKPDRIYILWNLSHPSTVTEEEYNAYDLVCIGSEKKEYIESIQERIAVPLRVLPMCVDTDIFYPGEEPYGEKKYGWVFVGNSRNVERKSVLWAVKHELPLKIWGANWNRFIPHSENYLVAENIPNSELPRLYRNAKVTIDDHYEDMIGNGFINTRILEAFACGLPVISDYSEVLTEMFGDAILCYRDEKEFVDLTKRVSEDYESIKEKVLALWPLIQEKYSFAAAVGQLELFAREIRAYSEACLRNIEDDPVFLEFCQNRARGLSEEEFRSAIAGTKEQFRSLPWKRQQAFESLKGREGLAFGLLVKSEIDMYHRWRKEACEKREMHRIYEKNEGMLRERLEKTYAEKSEINRKLQKTYAEKSEINRKLQITYDEKFDRGLEIKRLKTEIASIKSSRTYRLARAIGFPVRMIKKFKKKLQR